MCCMLLAGNTGRKNRNLRTVTQLCRAVSSTKTSIRQSETSLLNSNISPTCPYSMVNFGPLTAEIGPVVWGTPANFNGFRVLAALLHGSQVVSVSQTLRRWTEGANYVRQGEHHVGHWPTFQYYENQTANLRQADRTYTHSVYTHIQCLVNRPS